MNHFILEILFKQKNNEFVYKLVPIRMFSRVFGGWCASLVWPLVKCVFGT